jgi:pSer/pThr/pTyr-binding forkhead associated (FHA) protein
MDDYIDIKIDVFEQTGQHARVRKSLTVANLVQEVLREFDDISSNTPDVYGIFPKGADTPLDPAQTLVQLDIQPWDELVFEYVKRSIRQMLDARNQFQVRDETTGRVFDVQWQPAVIGRPSADVDQNMVLSINLQHLPLGQTVSRRHAQIILHKGVYYVEPLAENNPVYVNNQEIPFGIRRELRHGDRIGIGRSQIPLTFLGTSAPTTPVPDVKPPTRAASQVSGSVPTPPSGIARQAQAAPPTVQPSVPPSRPLTQPKPAPTLRLIFEEILQVDRIGSQLVVSEFPFVLGRPSLNLGADSGVSRHHAEISLNPADNAFYVRDLHSTNGVILNGQPLQPDTPYRLASGAKLGLGQLVLVRVEFV